MIIPLIIVFSLKSSEILLYHVTWVLRWLPHLCQVMHVNLFLETLHELHALTKHVM
jgi:hypothetical protein